jgi:hypothetical protein
MPIKYPIARRSRYVAEGYVFDHYNRVAIAHHLRAVGDKLMEAFGPNAPHAVFSDSLEVYGSDWTPSFLEEFKKRRGYDILPMLPALVGDFGEKTAAVRHDWGQTLSELAEENYLTPVREWPTTTTRYFARRPMVNRPSSCRATDWSIFLKPNSDRAGAASVPRAGRRRRIISTAVR